MALNILKLYAGNSQFIQISGLQDQTTSPSTYVNNATLSATLYDGTGVAVAGATNLTGTYQASSNGNYRFAVDPTQFNPPPAYNYVLKITGTYNSGVTFHAEIPAYVLTRTQGTET